MHTIPLIHTALEGVTAIAAAAEPTQRPIAAPIAPTIAPTRLAPAGCHAPRAWPATVGAAELRRFGLPGFISK
jgi:hypothetical protein